MRYHTKTDFTAAFERLLAPIREKLCTTAGHPDFGHTAAVYNQDAVYAEAFLRPLWGLVPYWYGGQGDEELKHAMRRAIVAGTDPESDTYWGKCERFDQRFVEMAPLATAILMVPEVIWDPLTDREKENLHAWMWQINEYEIPTNNWRFFRILTNIAFKHRGAKYSRELLDSDRADIESWYGADGWYHDGPNGQRDYYVAWAFHFYGLIYAMYEDDAYAETYRARAKTFAQQFIYWFSERGDSIPYGRSLTYRMAQGSFWSMCALAGVEVYDKAVIKGIVARHLDYWMSSPICDNGGVLTIGYAYPNIGMAEHYNAPGSPYWAMKFFAMLGIPDDDAFWSVEAAPLPMPEKKKLLPAADMLATRHKGDAVVYVPGTIAWAWFGQSGAKYLKFSYSTRFGFNIKMGDGCDIEALTDSTMMFNVGGVFCDRRQNLGFEMDEDRIITRWSPIDGIRVTTTITPDATGHTRHHVVESDYACEAYDCGYAVACRDEDECVRFAEGGSAEARNRFSLCRVSSEEGSASIVAASPNANVVYNKTVIPAVKYVIPKGTSEFTTRIDIE